MSFGMVAIAGAGLVGGVLASDAAKSAANTQASAANAATQSQQGMFDRTTALESPFQQAGVDAQTKLNTLLGIGPQGKTRDELIAELSPKYAVNDPNNSNGRDDAGLNAEVDRIMASQQGGGDSGSLLKPFGMSDFQLDPGIQFQTEQGNKALINSAAAKNGVLSGAALKDFIGYNQGMAGTGYQSAFDRYMAGKNFTLGSLMDTSKLGQAAASGVASAAPGFSSGIAGTITGAGNAQAAGTVGSANAISGGLTTAGNSLFLSQLLGKNGGSDLGGPITTSANPGGVYIAPTA